MARLILLRKKKRSRRNAYSVHNDKKEVDVTEIRYIHSIWLRGKDLNQRPPGYEPDELPTALLRDIYLFFTFIIITHLIFFVNTFLKNIYIN